MPTRSEAAAAARCGKIQIDVDERGPGDMSRPPGLTAVAGGVEVPAHVDDAKPRSGLAGQPRRVDERIHVPSYFIRVSGCGTFL